MTEHEIQFSLPEEKVLKDFGVAVVYLFGSQAQGTAGAQSDFDFAILLNDVKGFSHREVRNQVYESFYDMVEPKVGRLSNIDIVFLHEVNLQLQFHVIQSGKILWESDPIRRANFHAQTIEAHADFEPLRRIFHEATLKRI